MLTRHFPMRFVAIVVFFATLWLILWRHLSSEWSVNDQYSYGWFVPFFAIVLFWLRFEDRPAPRARAVRGHRSEVSDQTNNKQRITNNAAARTFAIATVALLLLF